MTGGTSEETSRYVRAVTTNVPFIVRKCAEQA
jgi:hypothetical protein